MNYLIEEQAQLDKLAPLIKELSETSGTVAVDTEFLREKTYSAKLCLVQLGIGDDQYCIDVLAIDDLSLLNSLFSDENVLKLLHAARQDMEVIYQTLGVLPKPIFDTQLAAAFCGSDMQIGYGGLVQDALGIELPKSQSRTDWTRRPLTAEQIEYAGDDVAYLSRLYDIALENLTAANKLDWYAAEIETYYDVDKYVVEPALAYKRLSGGGLRIKQQYILKALAEWREATAQKRNIPRTWVLRDDKLYDLATRAPKTEEQVIEMAVFGRKSASYQAPKVIELIESVEVGEKPIWLKVDPLSKDEKRICSAMMKQVASYSEEHTLAQALLGTRKDVEHLYRHRTSKKLLKGWREAIVGTPLLEYLHAEKA